MTDGVQPTPDPLWRGGLLADEMGLVKTLSMIALIASDQDYDLSNQPTTSDSKPGTSTCSTLIVVPSSCEKFASYSFANADVAFVVFGVWESELKTYDVTNDTACAC